MDTITVEVRPDHLKSLASVKRPVNAIIELVWNSLDADASHVDIVLEKGFARTLSSIRVSDDGEGISHDEAIPAFKGLGGSWKLSRQHTTHQSRLLHGKAGQGRFRAFALGEHVTWNSCFQANGQVNQITIQGYAENLGQFTLSDSEPSDIQKTGTEVIIEGLCHPQIQSLLSENTFQQIMESLAPYLMKYPRVHVTYDGRQVDPKSVQDACKDYPLPDLKLEDERIVASTLTIVEWKIQNERALVLCDENGFALAERQPGIHAPGFNFTAYLKSKHFRELHAEGLLDSEDMVPAVASLVESARQVMRSHFRERAAEKARDVVMEWKRENVYPYKEEARNSIETAERQVFDVCAVSINEYLPDFATSDPRSKRLSLGLLRIALQNGPKELRRVLEGMLELPKEKIVELAQILEKTTLSAVINASKLVADRLEFLKGIEVLIFDKDIKKVLRERKELHRLLAENTWLFGEEFNLSVDDQSLTEVLRKHLHCLGRDEPVESPVKCEDGSTGIVDLMLSRRIPYPRAEEREHLVVELKRPNVPVNDEVAGQIKKYAFAVAADERFKDTKTKWVFWAVSNDISPSIRKEVSQKGRPVGILYEEPDGQITVWVKTWGEILESCRGRLNFFQEHLQYSPDRESAMEYLKRVHEKYLPQQLQNAKKPDASPTLAPDQPPVSLEEEDSKEGRSA